MTFWYASRNGGGSEEQQSLQIKYHVNMLAGKLHISFNYANLVRNSSKTDESVRTSAAREQKFGDVVL